jgi:hypothetical protein
VAAHGIVRLDGPAGTRVQVISNEQPVGAFELGDDEDWVERSFDIPAGMGGERSTIELRSESAPVTVFHYWFVEGLADRKEAPSPLTPD